MKRVSRRALLGWIAGLALGVMVCGQACAQAPTEKGGIVGTWQGTLHAPGGHNLRTVLKVTKDDKGAPHGTLYSIDQGGRPIPTSSASFDDGTLKFGIDFLSLKYEGKMSADGTPSVGQSRRDGVHCRWCLNGRLPRRSGRFPRLRQKFR